MKLTACDEQDVNEIVDDRRCAKGMKQSLIAQAEKTDMKSELSATTQSIKNLAAFTLAEILLSLTVIGIVAAIALPSLLGNANERAWETQKKALYTRFSQSLPLLPSLNGYGQLEGTLSSNSADGKQHVDTDTAAESFIRDGLSKVMKITNICDNDHLTDCGLPDKINTLMGNIFINLTDISSLFKFNSVMVNFSNSSGDKYEQIDTKAAAFETVNGESILVYYNPYCEPDLKETDSHYSQPKMCANFVYDLNGNKGPNTVGKDIGFITAMYSSDPYVVAPIPHSGVYTDSISYADALAKCKEMGDNIKLPTMDELTSIFYNVKLLGITTKSHFWSSTMYASKGSYWRVSTNSGARFGAGVNSTTYGNVYCIKR